VINKNYKTRAEVEGVEESQAWNRIRYEMTWLSTNASSKRREGEEEDAC
jgi:hypothetical protein